METCYDYDAEGNLAGIRYPNGGVEERSYRNGKLAEHKRADGSTMRYTYDANGNCTCMENGAGEKLSITYDALNRRESVISPDGGTVRYQYDALGNITKVTDANGHEICYAYTPNGNLSKVTDALGNETRYTYDPMGRLVKVERMGDGQPDKAAEVQATLYQWDRRGLVTSITDPLGAEESFGYDKNGRMTDKWDRDGNHTRYGYDSRGLLKDILYGDGNSVSYSYDALGRLEEAKDASGVTKIINDALGRVLSVTDPQGRETGYEWGSMGERLRVLYPEGKEAAYGYNERGQLSALSTGNGTITYAYDPLGHLKEKVFPDGTVTRYTFTGAGQLEKISHIGKGIEEEYSYRYDKAGNKVGAEKKRQGIEADSGTFAYLYDALNRLTEVSRDGQLLRKYTYDAFGNRTLKEDYGNGTPVQTMYRYNAKNQLVSLTDREGEQAYSYDRRGNLTAVRRGGELLKAFAFDAADRMGSAFQIKGGIGKRAEYAYNAFGNRTEQTIYSGEAKDGIPDMGSREPGDPEKQIRYTIDLTKQYHNVLMSEENVGGKTQTFYWDGNVAAMEEAGQDSYYLQDDLGSPMQLLDGYGEIRESYGFDEFGQSLFPDGEGKAQPFGYTGYEMEEAGGLYFAQARRYDAGVGRFISKDRDRYQRCCYPNTLNQYIYCENNPIAHIDSSGNSIEDFYEIEPNVYAPVQVRINDNTITIDAYVDITGDINTVVDGLTAHDLVVDGIETWAKTYDNVFGNEAKVEVNVYEKYGPNGVKNAYGTKQNFVDIKLIDGAGTACVRRSGDWSSDNTGYITMYTSMSSGTGRDKKDYSNTVAHEFGHILGIDDGYEDVKNKGKNKNGDWRRDADMLEGNDMMRNNHYNDSHISDIDIQMMIMAASTNERQYFMDYDVNIQSKGVFIYEMCDTD